MAGLTGRIEVPYAPTQAIIDAWAELSGDLNPLHISPGYAASTRFGGTIAHGHLTLAQMERAMMTLLGEPWLHGGALEEVRFTAPVRPGHDYLVVAEPAEAPDDGRSWVVEVRALADSSVCATGTASLPA